MRTNPWKLAVEILHVWNASTKRSLSGPPHSAQPNLTENTHYWNHNLSYNGATQRGIYVGNALPSVCATGDGAWITTQAVGGAMTGMVGKNPATPITGILYRCGSGNSWAAYYTPYAYPHPLRGSAIADTLPPAKPNGLSMR